MPATDACASKTLEIQTLLQGMNAVSSHGELGLLRVFQGRHDTAETPIYLRNPIKVKQRPTVNSDEFTVGRCLTLIGLRK